MLKITNSFITIFSLAILAFLLTTCDSKSTKESSKTEKVTNDIEENSEENNPDNKKNSPSINGKWQVNGSQPEGDSYEGSLEIKANQDKTYALEWNLSSGIFSGTGLYHENKKRMFAAYGIKTKSYGLFTYTIEGDTLADKSVWTSGYGMGSETLLEKPNQGIIGTYKVKGFRPKEDVEHAPTYEGILKISKGEKSENTYKMTWDLGDNKPYNGIAFLTKDGTQLVGAWGIGGEYGAVIYNFKDNHKATGVWARQLKIGFGKESITR